MGRFFGIGLGPGEPELVTLKAYRVLQRVDTIFVPRAEGRTDAAAERILIRLDIDQNKFYSVSFPMTGHEPTLKQRYLQTAELILERLKDGRDVAYVTIGDPLLYSTYIYLLEALGRLAPRLKVETIPGITSYSAMASRFNYSLAEKSEQVLIYPATGNTEELERAILSSDTTVIMKAGRWLKDIMAVLEKHGLTRNTIFASRLGLEGERLVDLRKGASTDNTKPEGYLSTIIVRRKQG